ncbi:MAG: TolC family protein [Bacteroidales bacterium]|jgi:outer membrane protein|nr:TolC family protein [Bacteroidales bacterium]
MRSAFLFLFVFWILNGLGSVVSGQEVWTLDRCLDHALKHNLDLRLQVLAEGEAAVDVKQGYGNLVPSLGAHSQQGYNYGRTVDRFTNEFVTERVFLHNLYAGSEMVLFSGFQNINQIRYYNANRSALRFDTQKLKNDIVLAVSGAYLQILYYYDVLEVAEAQLGLVTQQLGRTRVLYEGGKLAQGALLEMEAQVARERTLVQQAKNNLRLSELELIHLLQLAPDEPFTLERPVLEVNPTQLIHDSGQVFEKALGHEPSIQAAAERIAMAGNNLAIARGAYSPRLVLSANLGTGYSGAALDMVDVIETGTYQTIGFTQSNEPVFQHVKQAVYEQKPYRDQLRDNYNTQFSLSLSIPILNRFQTRNRVSRARIQLEGARVQLEQARYRLHQTVQQAHADALAAYETYKANDKSLQAFEQAFRYAEQRFSLGVVSSIEYNEARTNLAQARAEALQAKYKYIYKLKILEFYSGDGFSL